LFSIFTTKLKYDEAIVSPSEVLMKQLLFIFALFLSACGETPPETPSVTATPSPEKAFALSYDWLDSGEALLVRSSEHWLRITSGQNQQILPEQPLNPEANLLHWQAPLAAFSTYEANQHHFRSMRLPSGEISDLGTIPANASPLMAWDPEGKRLAVTVMGLTPTGEGLPLVDASIYILTPGQAPRRIMTRTQAGIDTGDGSFSITQLRWRPDGQLLAASEHIAAATTSKLWRINPDGSEHQEILSFQGRTVRSFSLAPTSGRLAMIVQARIDRQGIYLAEADGSGIQRLLGEDEHQTALNEIHWTPDQKALVYTSRPLTSGSYADIQRLELGDNQIRNLSNTPERQEQQLQWSPSGQLTYVIGQASPGQQSELGLYQMPSEGGRRETLLQFGNLSP
jgi:hypothetical protein